MDTSSVASASASAPDYIEVPEPSRERIQIRLMKKVMDAEKEMAQELLKATTGLGKNLDVRA